MKNMATPEQDIPLLQEALDLSSDAVSLYACIRNTKRDIVDFRVVAMNRLAQEWHGVKLTENPGPSVKALYAAISNSPVWQKAVEVAECRIPYKTTLFHTFPLTNRSGWFHQTIQPWGDGVAIAYHDISDLIRNGKRPNDRELLFQSVMDNTVNGIVGMEAVRDETGQVVDLRYLFINRTALRDTFRQTGVTQDVTGKLITDFFPHMRESSVWQMYLQVLETKQSLRQEQSYQLDGYDVWIDLTVSPLGDGLLISYLETTEEKKLIQQAQHHARLLQTIIDNSPFGMVLFRNERDADGRVTDLRFVMTNQVNAQFANRTPEEMVGRLNLEIFPGAAETGMQQKLIHTAETGEAQRFVMNYDADGIDVWADMVLIPYDDGVLLVYLDVSELYQERKRLEQLNHQLRQSNDNLQQFAYVASHDMQEPLRKIRAFGDLLSDNYTDQLSADGLDLVRRMQSSAARMQNLVQDLLTYSRLTTHRRPFEPVNLDQLLQQVMADLKETIDQEKADVRVGHLPSVQGDIHQLFQLFHNLISNAVKFHRPGVQPNVSITGQVVRAQDVPGLEASKTRQQYVRIDVQDDGIGFEEIYRERIFQLFQRLNGRSQYAGTGIGLAIGKKIVENHNGFIQSHSLPDQGATFTVYLPT